MAQPPNPIVDALDELKLDLSIEMKHSLNIQFWTILLSGIILILLDFFLTKYYGGEISGMVTLIISIVAFLKAYWMGKSGKIKN